MSCLIFSVSASEMPAAPDDARVFFAASPTQVIEPNSLWVEAGNHYNVDPWLLLAVAVKETRRIFPGEGSSPWPWTVRAGDTGHRFDTKAEAVAYTKSLIKAGTPLWKIDVGLTQLNLKWTWEKRGYNALYSLDELFEPNINTGISAAIVSELVADGVAPSTIGRYNTYREPTRSEYGADVLKIYHQLKQTAQDGRYRES